MNAVNELIREWRGRVHGQKPHIPPPQNQNHNTEAPSPETPGTGTPKHHDSAACPGGPSSGSKLQEELAKLGVKLSDDELEELLYQMQVASEEEAKKRKKMVAPTPQEGGEQGQGKPHEAEGEDEKEDRPGRKNSFKNAPVAYDLLTLKQLKERRFMNTFALIVGKVSEDLVGFPLEGDDEWDIKAISERKISKRKVTHCRQSRERDKVVLMLDSSGSCELYAKFYQKIAKLAVTYDDVELYDTPNGHIYHKWSRREEKFVDYSGRGKNTANPGWWSSKLKGRTILYFSDFDGMEIIGHHSLHNKVYWFSPEHYDSEFVARHLRANKIYFKGAYYGNCKSAEDLIRIAKRVR